ncbi:hypothetical protein ACLOJK_025046 [Asimina triloba]
MANCPWLRTAKAVEEETKVVAVSYDFVENCCNPLWRRQNLSQNGEALSLDKSNWQIENLQRWHKEDNNNYRGLCNARVSSPCGEDDSAFGWCIGKVLK